MRILHCCLACFYVDNYGYQENLLPRYHKRMGHEVKIVASTESFDKKGRLTYVNPGKYKNEDGIEVERLPYVKYLPFTVAKKARKYIGLKACIDEFKPEFIFIHDAAFMDINIIARYAKNHKVKIVADCHTDFGNSAKNWISRYILHGVIYRRCASIIEPYTTKFFGTLPIRVDFLKQVYKLPENKCDLLVMGADDEQVNLARREGASEEIREKFSISKEDFLVVTGGKIDNNKPQVIYLMEAVAKIDSSKIKLLVFGSVTPQYEAKVKSLVDGKKIQHVGWANTSESYRYFSAADVVVFPGLHSVYWEQVCGLGKPMIVSRLPGTDHIDFQGNVRFLNESSVEEISKEIMYLYSHPEVVDEMKTIAESKAIEAFSYKTIAKKCLEC